MWLQLLLVFIAFILLKKYQAKGDTKKNRDNYVSWLMLFLIIQSGFRNVAVGTDTFAYYRIFESVKVSSWNDILYGFYEAYILGKGKDPGYALLQKIFQFVCPYYQLFLLCIAFCFFIPLGSLLKRELSSLKELFLSFCIYQTIFYGFFSITGIRQTVATIATLIGIKYILESKLVKFIVVILLASFIHKSVLIFLPFYFLSKLTKVKLILLISMISIPIIMPFSRSFAILLSSFSVSSNYMSYAESDYQTSGAVNFLILILLCGILVYLSKRKFPLLISDYVVVAIALAIIFTPLVWVDPSLMRVVQYYSIFMLIALPKAIENLKYRGINREMIYLIFIIVLISTIIKNNTSYAFFWQDMALESVYL